MKAWLTRRWYTSTPAPWFLRPLSQAFGLVAPDHHTIQVHHPQRRVPLDREDAGQLVPERVQLGQRVQVRGGAAVDVAHR